MTDLEKICSLEFVDEVLHEGIDIDELIEKLVLKAQEEAPKVKSMEQLEGKATKSGNNVFLKQCPMSKLINTIKEKRFQETGKKDFPDFYKKIIQRYIEKYPSEAAVLHPFCIVHQGNARNHRRQ